MKLITIPWSRFPLEGYMEITLTNPSVGRDIYIPHKPRYIAYQAYFPFIEDQRIFEVVFPYYSFKRAIKALPAHLRQDLTRPVTFWIMKLPRGNFRIKDWTVHDEEFTPFKRKYEP